MEELTDELYEKIDGLCEGINEFIDSKNYSEALRLCEQGYSLLPEPKQNWDASYWFIVTFGDIYFFIRDYEKSFEYFMKSMFFDEAIGQPFLHLRLGETAYELGNFDKAADELTRAYAFAGKEIFDGQDRKYFDFLKTRIEL